MLSEQVNLVLASAFIMHFKIQIGHPGGYILQFHDWFRNSCCYEPDQQCTYQSNYNSNIGKEFIGDLCTVSNTFQWRANQEKITIIQYTPHFEIVCSHSLICGNCQAVPVRIFYLLQLVIPLEYIIIKSSDEQIRVSGCGFDRIGLCIYNYYAYIVYITYTSEFQAEFI